MPAVPRRALRSLALAAAGLLAAATAAAVVGEPASSRPAAGAKGTTGGRPDEHRLDRARPFLGDVRLLPQVKQLPPRKRERRLLQAPAVTPAPAPGTALAAGGAPLAAPLVPAVPAVPGPSAPAPAPSLAFDGLDYTSWGSGHPSDSTGDVGPVYYVEAINSAVGIFDKATGARVAAFTIDTLMSQGNFGNLCDTDNFGDPLVVYDSFEDRWVVSDFAFQLDGTGTVVNPPGAFQCFAVSRTGDPVTGGWNFYSFHIEGGLNDYSKLGVWSDGLYMSTNLFSYTSTYLGPRAYAFDKLAMYAGAATVRSVSFDAPSGEFTLLPAHARLQTGTPPPGTPNHFAVVWQYLNEVSVYDLHVDWSAPGASTFTGPFMSQTSTLWALYSRGGVTTVPSPANALDSIYPRLMMQLQYTNIGGVESLWATHTVGAGNPVTTTTSTQAAVRYYQVKVTGGVVEPSATQAYTYSPDATVYRFMPSLAVNRVGDLAIGYSASSATLNPAIRYAGRLAGDAANTITQTEQSLIEGTGTQSGNCGASTCSRWGDYSAMALDPDGCTFWYVNQYYATSGLAYRTRIGSFTLPGGCTAIVPGDLSGTVTSAAGGAPVAGATVALGSRTTTTAPDGTYAFTGLPAGTFPSLVVTKPGFLTAAAASVAVPEGSARVVDFALTPAPAAGCLTDTTFLDFQAGVLSSVDLTASPGDVRLSNADVLDQANTTVGTTGTGITTTTYGGQTFTPARSGNLVRADVGLFCAGCTGTTPALTLSVRATSGGLPTGADLTSATITGFGSGALGYYTATFASPFAVVAGTQYALVVRPTTNPSAGTYALIRSGSSTLGVDAYAGGRRLVGATSGTVWSAPTTGGVTTDAGFRVYVNDGYSPAGTLESSVKDGNPGGAAVSDWGTLSFTATTPAGTAVAFQAAAADSPDGPFVYVGPDGTAGTSFANGDSLARFGGHRYLRYRAALASADRAATPTLSDVTVCYANVVPAASALEVSPASGTFGGTADLAATLTSGGIPVAGASVAFSVNGTGVGSGTTDGAGVARMAAVSLAGLGAGTHAGAIGAAWAGSVAYGPSSGSAALDISPAAQAITFAPLADRVATDPAFDVTATGGDAATPVTFSTASTACSVSGLTVTLRSAGSCAIRADQAGDANHLPAPPVVRTFTVSLAAQAITFPDVASFGWKGGSATLAAAADSTLPVTYSVTSGPCEVAGTTLTATGAGACEVAADQAGDARFAAAPQVRKSVTVTKASQAITFAVLADRTGADPDFALTATGGGSTSPVTFSTSSTACSVTSGNLAILSAGSCTVLADQAGDANHDAAPQVARTFAIALGAQTITFPAPAAFRWLGGSAALGATSTSGLSVGYAVLTGPCAVSGSTLTASAPGACTVAADQAGSAKYAAAARQTASATVDRAAQTILFAALPDRVATDAPFGVSATGGGATSPVTFSTSSTACSVAGSTVTLVRAGGCTVQADQAGDASYDAAPAATQSFLILHAGQAIAFPAIDAFVWLGGSAPLAATATSGLAPVYSVLSGPCAATGTTLHAVGAGTCTVAADQPGDEIWAAAPQATASVDVGKAAQAISFAALPDRPASDAPFALSATGGGSSSPVVFSSASTACTVSLGSVTLVQAGPCAVDADEAGDANYEAAPTVTRTFAVTLAAQTITFPAIAPFAWQGGSATLAAAASSGLPVAYAVLSGPCAVAGSTLTASGAGACTVAADQAGSARYAAAARATQTVAVQEPPAADSGGSGGCGCGSAPGTGRGAELALFGALALALRRRGRRAGAAGGA